MFGMAEELIGNMENCFADMLTLQVKKLISHTDAYIPYSFNLWILETPWKQGTAAG
jgi:hypothetical protein